MQCQTFLQNWYCVNLIWVSNHGTIQHLKLMIKIFCRFSQKDHRGGTRGNSRYQNTFRPVERLQMMIARLIEPSHVKDT